MKFLKVGRVAIITRGRYAGKKVVIIQPVDNGNKPHPFGHALVAGIERYPSKITRRMSKTRQEKRNKIKPFIKVINYNHLMPTRYTLELEGLKGAVSNDTFKEVSQREDAKKTVKKVLEERYTSGKNRWFFTPLSTLYRPCAIGTWAELCTVTGLPSADGHKFSGSKATKKGEDEESGSNKNSDLAEDRLASTKVGPLSVGVSNVTLELLISELVVDHATESNGVTKELERRNLGAPDHHGSTDQENILYWITDQYSPGETYKENNGDVEHESAETVQEESEQTNVVNLGHCAVRDLPDEGNDTVHDSANGSKVVQRDKGVHLVVSRAQEALDHGESESLKDDTTHLEQHTNGHKVDFAHGRNDDTDNNG
ncbi:hypothetical protein HG531_006512 [Fusarium graminearum]|nr:hypothetical protein HG531_006512 [Fusarium graminearum]